MTPAEYAAALDAALHGPRRAKRRLVDEITDGYCCAVEEDGCARALVSFGRPADLVPACQRELTVRQTRATARALTLTVPVLLAGWHLLWIGTTAGAWRLAATVPAAVVALAAVFALAAVLLTGPLGRRVAPPGWLPTATALSATVAAVGVVAVTGVLVVTTGPLGPVLLVALATAAGHGVVASSGRACRRAAGALRAPG